MSTKASYKTLQLLLCILWISACTPPSPKVPREDHDLLRTMEQYQRFSQKLWFASDAKNWKLADFYSHELEEVTEELVESKVNYEGHDISNLAEHIIRPNIEQLEKAIDQEDEVLFLKGYDLMIKSCNTCHQATNHAFIKIIKPNNSAIFNQDFRVSAP